MLPRCCSNFVRKNSVRVLNFQKLLYSTQPVAKKITETNLEKQLNDLEGLSTSFKKRAKLPQRDPFAKRLFIGKFDLEILTYPQLQKEDVEELEKNTAILNTIFSKDKEPSDLREFLQKLRNLKCLGLECPSDLGGRDLNPSESCRFNEILLSNKFRLLLINNELSIFLLSKFGNEEQKAKYLPRLIDGSISSTIGIGDNGLGKSENLAVADTEDLKTYILNGSKKYVVGANEADLFIIFTKMADSVEDSIHEMDLTAFLIDSNSPGITIEQNNNSHRTSNIKFNNTTVPMQNVLGKERDGRNILSAALSPYHLSSSIVNLNIHKDLLNRLSQDLLKESTPGEEVYKTDAVTSQLGGILKNSYITESVIYLTSGIMSTYENQDCEMEALITRVLTSELAVESTEKGLSMCGISSGESNHFCQELHQEAVTQFVSFETMDMLKILIALLGLQYSGKNIGDTVKKLRNPMFNPAYILKKIWQNRKQVHDEPSLELGLKNHLHLSCQEAADQLEYCVLRLQYATEMLFARHGIEILNKHSQLRRLADSVMQIYAMTACLGRASRSYCIGLEQSNLEIVLAGIVCRDSTDIVKKKITEILYEYDMSDLSWSTLAEELYKNRNYYFAHPLTRNF